MTIDLGAYLLGALEPDEEVRLSEHLQTCTECRDENEMLRGLPDRLRLLTPADPEVLELIGSSADPSGDLPGRTPEGSGRRRTRRVLVGALAAAVATVAVAGGLVVAGRSRDTAVSQVTTVAAADRSTHVRADVRLTSRGWGTQLAVHLSGVAPGERCTLVARAQDGRRDSAASWVATYNGTVDIEGTTAIPRDALSSLDIVTSSGQRLLAVAVPAAKG